MQPSSDGAKSTACKSTPEEVLDVQDAGKTSELDYTVCHSSSKSGLGVKLGRVCDHEDI